MSITKHMSQFENVPFRSLALICPISAPACALHADRSGENYGTLMKLQRYPRNTQCIPVIEIFAFPRSKSGIFDLNLKKIKDFFIIDSILFIFIQMVTVL